LIIDYRNRFLESGNGAPQAYNTKHLLYLV